MQQNLILVAVILGISLILSVFIHVFGKLKIEQQKTLQKLLDQGPVNDMLAKAIGINSRQEKDFRRGLAFIAIGASWTLVTFFIGGKAWILGFIPVMIGLVYLLLWKFDGTRR